MPTVFSFVPYVTLKSEQWDFVSSLPLSLERHSFFVDSELGAVTSGRESSFVYCYHQEYIIYMLKLSSHLFFFFIAVPMS